MFFRAGVPSLVARADEIESSRRSCTFRFYRSLVCASDCAGKSQKVRHDPVRSRSGGFVPCCSVLCVRLPFANAR